MATGHHIGLIQASWDPERVAIYKRADKGDRWYVRIKLEQGKKRYTRKSLQTSDLSEAKRRAHALWREIITAEDRGVVYGDTNFSTLFARFIQSHDWKQERLDRIQHVFTRYFSEYFGTMSVKHLQKDQYVSYLRWRWDYWELQEKAGRPLPYSHGKKAKHPSNSTLRSERQILVQFLKWCEAERIISDRPVLEWDFSKLRIPVRKEKNRGIAIEQSQYRSIIGRMRHYSGIETWKRSMLLGDDPMAAFESERATVVWARLRLYYFVLLTGHALLRQGTEATRLRWRNVRHKVSREGRHYAELWVREGKKGERDYPALVPAGNAYKQFLEWASIAKSFGCLEDDHHIFGSLDGEEAPAHYIGRLHSRFLKAEGHQYHEGQPDTRITLYSYRHTAISRRITEWRWDPLRVAEAANTSLMTISKSYAHDWKRARADSYVNPFEHHPNENMEAIAVGKHSQTAKEIAALQSELGITQSPNRKRRKS
jgi:hypothetical protein